MTSELLFTDKEYRIITTECVHYGISIISAYDYPNIKWCKSVTLEFETIPDLVLLLRCVLST